jgi:hypothetical protein
LKIKSKKKKKKNSLQIPNMKNTENNSNKEED